MSNTLRILFNLSFATALLVTAACNKDNDDNGGSNSDADIQPGIGLRDVKIGDPAQKAFDRFGIVSDSHVESGGKYYHFLFYITQGVIVNLEPTDSETLDLSTPIRKIILSDPYVGKTAKNISIGSTKTEVVAAYGQPDSFDPLNGDVYDIGIAIDYDNDDQVSTIAIPK